jgi:D-3-phosphoglycerate dehydrogenase
MSDFRVGITADVLSSDGEPIFGREVLGLLDADGIAWEYMEQAPDGLTPAQAARYDAVCAMLTRVTPASLAGPDRRLKLIARFGVGYDTIDVPACTAAGVLLTIAPDGVRRPVATSALTFVLMLAQKVLIKDRLTRNGRWSEKLDHIGTGLTGRTLGSIGLGNIGAELFRIARPLEMNGIAHDPYADPALAAALGVRLVDLETLFRESDFLAVNCPLSDATRGLVRARRRDRASSTCGRSATGRSHAGRSREAGRPPRRPSHRRRAGPTRTPA